jgi:hypothetical protein
MIDQTALLKITRLRRASHHQNYRHRDWAGVPGGAGGRATRVSGTALRMFLVDSIPGIVSDLLRSSALCHGDFCRGSIDAVRGGGGAAALYDTGASGAGWATRDISAGDTH